MDFTLDEYLLLADFFGFVMLGVMLLAILLEDRVFEGKLGLNPGRSLGLGFVVSLSIIFSLLHFGFGISVPPSFPVTSKYSGGEVVGIGAGIAGLLLLIAYIINRKQLIPGVLYRKVTHILGGVLGLLLVFLSRYWTIVLSGWAVGALIALEHIRKKPKGYFQKVAKTWVNSALRREETNFYATVAFAAGLFCLLLYLEPPFVYVGMIVVMVGDTTAFIVGKKYGRHKWFYSPKKSIEGTAAGIIASIIFSLPAVGNIPLVAILVGVTLAMMLESLPFSNVDNFVLPVSGGYITYLLTALTTT